MRLHPWNVYSSPLSITLVFFSVSPQRSFFLVPLHSLPHIQVTCNMHEQPAAPVPDLWNSVLFQNSLSMDITKGYNKCQWAGSLVHGTYFTCSELQGIFRLTSSLCCVPDSQEKGLCGWVRKTEWKFYQVQSLLKRPFLPMELFSRHFPSGYVKCSLNLERLRKNPEELIFWRRGESGWNLNKLVAQYLGDYFLDNSPRPPYQILDTQVLYIKWLILHLISTLSCVL